jgi:hypothetical protein
LSINLAAAVTAPAEPRALTTSCDAYLRSLSDSPLAYRLRGDRCEGLYAGDVARTSLLIASFTTWSGAFDPQTGRSVPLFWPTARTNQPTHIRAVSLQSRIYYRMDALSGQGTTSYAWSPDVLAALRLKRDDLGLVAWTSQIVDGSEREVYLPLAVGGAPPTGVSSHSLVVIPGVGLGAVFVTLMPVSPGADPHHSPEASKLPGGFFAPDVPFTVPVPRPKLPGLYRLTIGATTMDGGSVTADILFFEPSGRSPAPQAPAVKKARQ